ncbi:MAG TPA: DUF2335 domain-containing protein [Candidatus Limnocylindria bacterium]|nr:DUF2335 domain-containing protein [Candidatus Limnocylindria bacterium]
MPKKTRGPKKVQTGEVVQNNDKAEIPQQELTRLLAIAERYEGPLPKASEFAAYERIHKGAAHRIIRMAEKALGAEIFAVRADKVTEFSSMLLSRLFLYALLGSAVYLVMQDKPVEAAFAGLAPIISVIYSTFKKPEGEKKARKPQSK